jgi:RNA recognition motif. (a.k.a. RRM, RBD, or RNP domain)
VCYIICYLESLVTMGASSRSYRFFVDTEKHLHAKKLLYDRLANPDILTAKTEEQNNENTVFVGNIPFEAREADVREFFAVCGAILSVHMPQGERCINKILQS